MKEVAVGKAYIIANCPLPIANFYNEANLII
jgi:hypothetical protein